MEILQDNVPLNKLDEAEYYWINFYGSTNRDVGYNILNYGNVSGRRGVENCNAIFQSQDDLNEILDLLKNHLELSYLDIANKYNIHPSTIYKINYGITYKQDNVKYPIRINDKKIFARKDSVLDYFQSLNDLILFKEDLKYRWDLSLENDIPKKWSLPLNICRQINHGEKFAEYGNFTYPIRNKSNTSKTQGQIMHILQELRDSNKSMTDIGKENGNLHRNTISKINLGINYPVKDYDYPARRKNL